MLLKRNVLIFHLGALGDFVLTWPLAAALARVYPQSRIIYVTHGQKGKLAEKVLRVESADIEGGWHELFSPSPSLPEPAGKMLGGARIIYSFVNEAQGQWERNVAGLAPDARLITLRPRPHGEYTRHVTEHLVEQLRDDPAVQSAVGQMLRLIADRGLGSQRSPQRRVVVHPGAGSPTKCWPVQHYIELIERLRDDGVAVTALLGEVEQEQWDSQAMAALQRVAEVRRPATYLELLDAMLSAAVFVGNDSGPGHLAGVMGVPVVSLFGPTDPRVWHSPGPHVHVLHQQPLASLPVSQVFACVRALLPR